MNEQEPPLYLAVYRRVSEQVESLPKESVMHITEVLKELLGFHEKLTDRE